MTAEVSCVGACWALMLATVSIEVYYLPLMLLGATVVLFERQAPTRPPASREL